MMIIFVLDPTIWFGTVVCATVYITWNFVQMNPKPPYGEYETSRSFERFPQIFWGVLATAMALAMFIVTSGIRILQYEINPYFWFVSALIVAIATSHLVHEKEQNPFYSGFNRDVKIVLGRLLTFLFGALFLISFTWRVSQYFSSS